MGELKTPEEMENRPAEIVNALGDLVIKMVGPVLDFDVIDVVFRRVEFTEEAVIMRRVRFVPKGVQHEGWSLLGEYNHNIDALVQVETHGRGWEKK